MAQTFENLIERAESGTATEAELERIRAEMSGPDWLGIDASIRDAVLDVGESVDVADAVMAAIDVERLPVGEAVRFEAGEADVAAGVLASLALDGLIPVGEAVRFEAGELDDAVSVLAALELDVDLAVGQALHAEAGDIDLAHDVMAALGLESTPVAEAVASEAGAVDVVAPVVAKLGLAEAMPAAAVEAPALPAPANSRRWFGALLAAAMVMVVVGAGSLVGGGVVVGTMLSGATGQGGVEIAGGGAAPRLIATEMVFASAAEVVVEDLSFGDDVTVFQDEGDDGALILWVDEEVL